MSKKSDLRNKKIVLFIGPRAAKRSLEIKTELDSESDTVQPAPAKKTFRKQKFRDAWLQDPNFTSWLEKCENPYKVKCTACNSIFTAGKSELMKHLRTTVHTIRTHNREIEKREGIVAAAASSLVSSSPEPTMDHKDIPYSRTGDKEEDELLLEPFGYILQVPGKQIRAKLAHAFNYWLKIPQDKLRAVGDIIQLLHTSSLLIDDIEDSSVLRRGIPVAHNIYGTASTINAANYVLFIALERVLALNHPEGTQVYVEQLLELHRGQGMEIYWRDNYICPTETAYRQMTIRKTGGLFNLAVRLMQLFSDCKEDFMPLAGILGLYFQIRDDYSNLCLQEYAENKSYCEDLSEGKFSFPIIHAIQSHPEDRQLMNILRQRTKDIEVKRYCVKLLDKFGSFAYTRNVLEELDKRARSEVQRLGGNPLLLEVLDELMSWKHQDIQTPHRKSTC